MDKVRIDKWLWAARFFKTRSLAKAAIENGKIKVNNQRPKPSRELSPGDTLSIRQGWDEKIVTVIALSDQRRGAPEAATLYRETEESLQKRQREAELRKLNQDRDHPGQRPTKKQRRHIHRFKERDLYED
ncbi:MAG: RNA-binding S4 domain-containing protein [Porticoccaceae bacterium]|jgi:ribosome-associated heat shock protein Hsp15